MITIVLETVTTPGMTRSNANQSCVVGRGLAAPPGNGSLLGGPRASVGGGGRWPAPGRGPIHGVPSIRPQGRTVRSTDEGAGPIRILCSAKPRSCSATVVYGSSCGGKVKRPTPPVLTTPGDRCPAAARPLVRNAGCDGSTRTTSAPAGVVPSSRWTTPETPAPREGQVDHGVVSSSRSPRETAGSKPSASTRSRRASTPHKVVKTLNLVAASPGQPGLAAIPVGREAGAHLHSRHDGERLDRMATLRIDDRPAHLQLPDHRDRQTSPAAGGGTSRCGGSGDSLRGRCRSRADGRGRSPDPPSSSVGHLPVRESDARGAVGGHESPRPAVGPWRRPRGREPSGPSGVGTRAAGSPGAPRSPSIRARTRAPGPSNRLSGRDVVEEP